MQTGRTRPSHGKIGGDRERADRRCASALSAIGGVVTTTPIPESAPDEARKSFHENLDELRVDVGDRRMGATQRGTNTRQQLIDAERFGDVVVGAGVQPHDDVGFLLARGEHDDRSARRARTELPAEVDTVGVGEAEVEEHQIRNQALERRARGSAVGREGHREQASACERSNEC